MLASDLFAQCQGDKVEGDQECYYCGGVCQRRLTHGFPANPGIGVRKDPTLKRPANPYICKGCWLFNRTSITMPFLSGAIKDRQQTKDHSLWMTIDGYWGIRDSKDSQKLYEELLKPPLLFSLALLDRSMDVKAINLLRCMNVNHQTLITADTQLFFTINNVSHHYTVYELQTALDQKDTNGREPGVRLLIEVLGPYEKPMKKEQEQAGRPNAPVPSVHNTLKKTIRK